MEAAAPTKRPAKFHNSGLQRASEEAALKCDELDRLLSKEIGRYTSTDTSFVVFGSLARGEWTSGSDLDWTYLIDGQANSDHLRIAQKINRVVRERFSGPGPAG